MITIWIILLFVAVLAFLFFKFEHHLRLLKFALLALIVVMIYLSMNSVLSSESVDISSPKGIMNAVYVYVGWLGSTTAELFDIGKSTVVQTGNAVKVEPNEKADLPQQEEPFSLIKWVTDKIRKD